MVLKISYSPFVITPVLSKQTTSTSYNAPIYASSYVLTSLLFVLSLTKLYVTMTTLNISGKALIDALETLSRLFK